jgi:signal transduction histidine kinase
MERLENLFEAQRRFLADISHELRTPLTAIRGNVDLMRRMGKVDEESLQAITSEGERMTRMVQDLLLLARAETGNLPLAQEVVELDTLLLEAFQQAKMMAGDRLEVRLGKEDQVRVLGDRDRLKQVVLNLVANAMEHTPKDGTVTLGVSADGNWARLSVSDTGPGIPEEQQALIFDRFYRGDPSRKRSKEGGAGLGLSIADWITRRHNGRIELSSEVGRGTTFYVYLPQLREEGQKTPNGA